MKRLSYDELCDKYTEWWSNRTQDTYNLQMQILEYESQYFQDMLLNTPETSKIISILNDKGEECDSFYDFDLSLDAKKYTYNVESIEGYMGLHDASNNTITIDSNHLDDKNTILHEMVHAYENILDTCGIPFIKELLFLELYRFLQARDIDIDNRVLSHSNLLSGLDVAEQGGLHSVFFFLKTLELDIRCDLPLGTICGYDREKY